MESKEIILNNVLSNQSLAFHALLDIDDFGVYNSSFGFERGNTVLEEISSYVEQLIKPSFSFHMGSDEFLFSVENDNPEEFRDCISNLMRKVVDDLYISISVGITKADDLRHPSEIYAKLKSNVLMAKRNGKNLMCLR